MQLSALKAFFRKCITLALTATAPPDAIEHLKNYLCINNSYKLIKVSPNRKNIFLSKGKRLSNNYGEKGFQVILQPIAEQLKVQKECYPMAIIYLKLKYCGYAFRLFSRVIRDQYSGEEICPRSRLFAQFHAPFGQILNMSIYITNRKYTIPI